MINPKIKEKIVLALDVDDIESAKKLVNELKDYVGIFKVGLQFYTANGSELFEFMKSVGADYFLDVKFMDIPNTVAKASQNVIKKGADFFNVHALGGKEMMQKAMEAASETALKLGRSAPTVLAVTVLTSISNETLNDELEIGHNVNKYALKLAKLAKESGLTGVVASVFEARKIKEVCGADFKVLCPGIRPEWSVKDDQKRLATPKLAIEEGADYLVIGRAVTGAPGRLEAMRRIYDEIEEALNKKPFKIHYAKPARLLLDNGTEFEGESFGAGGTSFGEIVFNTSMAGYQEILTDPSYSEQVVVMTYPEIGNYGINDGDFESSKVHANGFIVKSCCERESHYRSVKTLDKYLKENGVVGIKNVDTRTITEIIRETGAMNCVLTTSEITDELKEQLKNYSMSKDVAIKASSKNIRRIPGSGVKLGIIDLGIKKSIVENFERLGCDITIFPANVSAKEILAENFDAALLSNGPGNPQDAVCAIECARELAGKLPLFGICLGHQILSIVLGAKTYKLKYGHRGGNHPVINLETNKVILTSQNHGYAVDENSFTPDMKATYKNLNDGTIEGFRCEKPYIEAVQFHPEAAPGPIDANEIFTKWINGIRQTTSKGVERLKS
ncbi:MAG: glutamine-hydrolyzing carbamoyl-phosphate synthase small subunit [Heliobacteriaceae bacterium]|jgi:carbamoyl-phosphate synthase small subunit|nr:glutamine-hydrolyzing carbamoyl-phosphate synthase small subunit [Heliobacteriaceae bacterium]